MTMILTRCNAVNASLLIVAIASSSGSAFGQSPTIATQSAQPASNAGSVSNSTAGSVLPTADNVNTPSGKSSVRTLVDDSILTTKIKAGMLADPGVKATEVSVETNSGEVTLSGAVSSHPEMEEAERIAKSVSGVKTVVNKLTLKK